MATVGYCSTKKLYYYGVKVHLIADQRFRTLPLPRFIGVTPARLSDSDALLPLASVLPYEELYGDKAYEHLTRDTGLPFQMRTPVKKSPGQPYLDAADATYSRAVSRVRQPVESIFNWIEDKTGIGTASQVRSYHGLLVHVFARLPPRCSCGTSCHKAFNSHLSEAAARCLLGYEHKRSIVRDAECLNAVMPHIGELELDRVHTGTLDRFVAERKAGGISAGTINRDRERIVPLNAIARSIIDSRRGNNSDFVFGF